MEIYNPALNIPDLVSNTIYDGSTFNDINEETANEVLDLTNQIVKYDLSNSRLEELKEQDDPDMFGMYTSNWFRARRCNNMLDVIGYRQAIEASTDDESYDKWLLEGYITYKDFANHFSLIYEQFKQEFTKYETAEWDLRINIIGSLVRGNLLIETDTVDSWAAEGVLLKHYGFNQSGNIISLDDLLLMGELDIEDAFGFKAEEDSSTEDHRFSKQELSQNKNKRLNELLHF